MTFLIPDFIDYIFSQITLYVTLLLGFFLDGSNIQDEMKNQKHKLSKRSPSFKYRNIQEHEVKMVMGNLGIFCNSKGDSFPKSLSCDDLFNIFEQQRPRLDEVKEAFDVFDENKDGYIDAGELHRVLSALGMIDRIRMDDCSKMIRVFDANNDGRIDFDEFLKFMEGTFC